MTFHIISPKTDYGTALNHRAVLRNWAVDHLLGPGLAARLILLFEGKKFDKPYITCWAVLEIETGEFGAKYLYTAPIPRDFQFKEL